jgi:type II secretory pathway pseudopilin PulG
VNALTVILIVLAVLVLVLAIGGFVAMSRRTQAREGTLLEQLGQAERELAKAHAADKGWDPAPTRPSSASRPPMASRP